MDDLKVIVRAARCGNHHHDDCGGCVSAIRWTNEQLDEQHARIEALEAKVKEAGEALAFVADRAAKLRAGTDDWFELVEFEMICRPVLAKLQEPSHDDQ